MQLVSNLASILTCITFMLYIIGKMIAISNCKYKILEEYEFCKDDDIDSRYLIDTAPDSKYKTILKIKSKHGIKKIKVYGIDRTDWVSEDGYPFRKGDLIGELKNIREDSAAYVGVELYDIGSTAYVEITRGDSVINSFIIADSGRDGSFVASHRKSKMTVGSWIYYLCN